MKKTLLLSAAALVSCMTSNNVDYDGQTAYDHYRLDDAVYVGESQIAGVYMDVKGSKTVFVALIDDYAKKGTCKMEIDGGRFAITVTGDATVAGSCMASVSNDNLSRLCDGDPTSRVYILERENPFPSGEGMRATNLDSQYIV